MTKRMLDAPEIRLLRGVESKLRKRLVIVGNGPAAGRLLDALYERQAEGRFEISVFGEEAVGCYNRVQLSRVLGGATHDEILLKDRKWYDSRGIRFHAGVRVTRLDLEARQIFGENGESEPFDVLVLATGSRAVVPRIPGIFREGGLLPGVHVFRSLDDCEAIRASALKGEQALVLGGGLLGLEAAKGLLDLGLRVTVLDRSPGPMSRQLDIVGQDALRQRLAAVGIECLGNASSQSVLGTTRVEGLRLESGDTLACQVLVLACGIHPRTELAEAAGIPVNRGILVNEWLQVDSEPQVFALGECAECNGELFGTVAPIWDQVEVLADVLAEKPRAQGFQPTARYTKLKVAGVDVASIGDQVYSEDEEIVTVHEPRRGMYRKLRIRDERLVGAELVGDVSSAARLLQYHDQGIPVPANRLDLLVSEGFWGVEADAQPEVCSCHHVGQEPIVRAIEAGARDLVAIGRATRAGTGCGSCCGTISRLLAAATAQAAE